MTSPQYSRWHLAQVPAFILMVAAHPVQAQDGRGVLHGSVVDAESGDRIPFAMVSLEPGAGARFSDSSGMFVFPRLTQGRYRLRVLQVGMSPFDTSVTINGRLELRVALHHIVVHLAALTVAARASCGTPAPADTTARSGLATILGQLRQNAERFRMLSDQYVFRYRLVRHRLDQLSAGPARTRTDTLEYFSSGERRYAAGHVIEPDSQATTDGDWLVHFPVLSDFADPTFLRAHCFQFRGVKREDGQNWIRVDFHPVPGTVTTDVEGSVFLDTATYQVRRLSLRLTLVGQLVPGVEDWTSTVTFRELVPNLIVIESMRSVTFPAHQLGFGDRTRIAEFRLLDVHFLRGLPQQEVTPPR